MKMDKAQRTVEKLETMFEGITTEITESRCTIYISGNTYPIKDKLKSEFSAQWAPDIKSWYINLVDKEWKHEQQIKQETCLAKDLTKQYKRLIIDEVNIEVYGSPRRTWQDELEVKSLLDKVIKVNPDLTYLEILDEVKQMTIDMESAIPENTDTEPAVRKMIVLDVKVVDDISTKYQPCYLIYRDSVGFPNEYAFISTEKMKKNSTYYCIVEEPYGYKGRIKIMEFITKSHKDASRLVNEWTDKGYNVDYKEFTDIVRTPTQCLQTIKHK